MCRSEDSRRLGNVGVLGQRLGIWAGRWEGREDPPQHLHRVIREPGGKVHAARLNAVHKRSGVSLLWCHSVKRLVVREKGKGGKEG